MKLSSDQRTYMERLVAASKLAGAAQSYDKAQEIAGSLASNEALNEGIDVDRMFFAYVAASARHALKRTMSGTSTAFYAENKEICEAIIKEPIFDELVKGLDALKIVLK